MHSPQCDKICDLEIQICSRVFSSIVHNRERFRMYQFPNEIFPPEGIWDEKLGKFSATRFYLIIET